MSPPKKRKDNKNDNTGAKKVRKECSYGPNCYRRNPAHLRDFCHPHLEAILDEYSGDGPFTIPSKFGPQRHMITEQLEVMVEAKVYEAGKKHVSSSSNQCEPSTAGNKDETTTSAKAKEVEKSKDTDNLPSSSKGESREDASTSSENRAKPATSGNTKNTKGTEIDATSTDSTLKDATLGGSTTNGVDSGNSTANVVVSGNSTANVVDSGNSTANVVNSGNSTANGVASGDSTVNGVASGDGAKVQSTNNNTIAIYGDCSAHIVNGEVKRVSCRDAHYRPLVTPKRSPEEFFKVVRPEGKMAEKHAASAPYHIFYTTISDAKETHDQPYSITFLEILDSSLGELKCSLQINFMVEAGWLLAQYYFAGYSEKRMTIIYGDDSEDMKVLSELKPHVDTHLVKMPSPFGTHHTKMMILCYEDGSLRVVVSTANLYVDDWENRTQGLWFSPRCPELPPEAMPHDGESPTMFKKSLLRYLAHYHLPCLTFYMDRVKRCDFSHINVFLVASAPGSHFDMDWGLARVGSLLKQHCAIPTEENTKWPLVTQASSLGSFGKEPKIWLAGDFLHHFTKIKNPPQVLSPPPDLRVIYPSYDNVRQSHDDLLGGGCLPYAANTHDKQLWLNKFMYEWKATHTHRNKAMPHIKCYTRLSPDDKRAAYYLLTSANTSKAAWGSINKGNSALRIMSYEAGVLFMPKFVINEDSFPLEEGAQNRLIIPYDLPLVKYTKETWPWVSDYLKK